VSGRIPLLPTLLVLAAVAVMIWLGVWQLQRAQWKQGLIARAGAAEKLPPITFPTTPMPKAQLPLFRHATGVCLKPLGQRAIAGENARGETGYVVIVDCTTGAEGPGMAVQLGWTRNPNAKVGWAGGLVSGIIVPDSRSGIRLVAASAPPGLAVSKAPGPASISSITPATHRGYAATWFALAAVALIVYGAAVWKRSKGEVPKA
jgi:cytochrome oxidase assembly protein ShyY1